MFTGKLFLGLRGGNTVDSFSKVGMRIMVEKVTSHCKDDVVIACRNDELGNLAIKTITQTPYHLGKLKITPVSEKEMLLFCEDQNVEMFADMHEMQNIWVQTDSRELNAIAKERIENFKLQIFKSTFLPVRNNQILCIDFKHRTIEKIF